MSTTTMTGAQQELIRDALGGFADSQRRQITGGHAETVQLINRLGEIQKLFSHANSVFVIQKSETVQ
jgi:hypothetical protein